MPSAVPVLTSTEVCAGGWYTHGCFVPPSVPPQWRTGVGGAWRGFVWRRTSEGGSRFDDEWCVSSFETRASTTATPKPNIRQITSHAATLDGCRTRVCRVVTR